MAEKPEASVKIVNTIKISARYFSLSRQFFFKDFKGRRKFLLGVYLCLKNKMSFSPERDIETVSTYFCEKESKNCFVTFQLIATMAFSGLSRGVETLTE